MHQDTISPPLGQGDVPLLAPPRRDYPASIAEAEAFFEQSSMPRPSRIETVGDWVCPRPKPLPENFRERLAQSIAADPEFFGRLFTHAIRSIREGSL